MLFKKKQTGMIERRLVADRSKQKKYVEDGTAALLTIMTESVLLLLQWMPQKEKT